MILKLGFMQGRLINSEKKNTIQYFPSKNWSKEFKIARKINLRIMEWTINNENLKDNPLYTGDLKKLRKIIKKYKIKVPSITNDFFMQKPFFKKKNKHKKNLIINKLKKIILNANKLGIKYHIYPLVDNGSIKNLEEEKILIYEIEKLSSVLNKNSWILFETDYNPNKVIKFLKKFKNKKIGINYDTGNSANFNYDFADEIKYFSYVKNIHLKDRLLKGGTVRLGKGNWNYKKFFKLIKKVYKGNFILQTARSLKNKHIDEILINKKFIENEYK